MSILIVDDDPIDRRFLIDAIRVNRPDLSVRYAEDGVKALEVLNSDPLPKLVLFDVSMPLMNGHAFLRELKSSARLRAIPAIAFSTADTVEEINLCYAESANAYLVKPSSIDGYRDAMGRLLSFWFGAVSLAR